MSQELLYTSAPKGLKSGAHGFCMVLCSEGMPAPLATALEGLSAYKPVYPVGDPDQDRNPVTAMHVILPAIGRKQHVLSRVASYGLDYSGRPNKLAHHVVLDARDMAAAGPAWLLAQPGVMKKEWSGEPKVVAANRRLPAGDAPPGPCRAWARATGDAGWAGVLAESLMKDPARLAYLIIEPGLDVLPLFAEAIALLPADRRWQATFSTYFTTLPAGATCNWRCLLADSPLVHQSKRHVHALRLDLTGPLAKAPDGEWVEYARTGNRPRVVETRPVEAATRAQAAMSSRGELAEAGLYDLAWPIDVNDRGMRPPRRRAKSHSKHRSLLLSAAALVIVIATAISLTLFKSREPTTSQHLPLAPATSNSATTFREEAPSRDVLVTAPASPTPDSGAKDRTEETVGAGSGTPEPPPVEKIAEKDLQIPPSPPPPAASGPSDRVVRAVSEVLPRLELFVDSDLPSTEALLDLPFDSSLEPSLLLPDNGRKKFAAASRDVDSEFPSLSVSLQGSEAILLVQLQLRPADNSQRTRISLNWSQQLDVKKRLSLNGAVLSIRRPQEGRDWRAILAVVVAPARQSTITTYAQLSTAFGTSLGLSWEVPVVPSFDTLPTLYIDELVLKLGRVEVPFSGPAQKLNQQSSETSLKTGAHTNLVATPESFLKFASKEIKGLDVSGLKSAPSVRIELQDAGMKLNLDNTDCFRALFASQRATAVHNSVQFLSKERKSAVSNELIVRADSIFPAIELFESRQLKLFEAWRELLAARLVEVGSIEGKNARAHETELRRVSDDLDEVLACLESCQKAEQLLKSAAVVSATVTAKLVDATTLGSTPSQVVVPVLRIKTE